jgi:alpha-D-xyloside xylohydrolase
MVHGQIFSSYKKTKQGVECSLPDGTLGIYPLSDNAVRVRFFNPGDTVLPELVFSSPTTVPNFHVVESDVKLEVSGNQIIVVVDKKDGRIEFVDKQGKVFLSEQANSRKFVDLQVMEVPCHSVELSFDSPADEQIFGLGQFQDGQHNLKGVARRLTQVNSQIAIPFIYSTKGYGLLWHQYGLTDFNPTDHQIALEKQSNTNDNTQLTEVTTTAGTQKVSQSQTLYLALFSVPADGLYSLFLDLGAMGNRYFVAIDDAPCLDQSNMWLPPTVGTQVQLKAGEHQVKLICKADNKPSLSLKRVENSTTFRSPHAQAIDYVVFYGPSADEVIASYRHLSGNVPLFPKWAYGFWQCRERYASASQLVEAVNEFRARQLPVDVIVQDWQYWGSRGWGVPQFDETNYPDPAGFIKELHDKNAHFNISIWSNPDKNSELGKSYVQKNRFISNTNWLDYFNPETRKDYWKTLNDNMFVNGVDSWWMDAVEPENDALHNRQTHLGPGDFYRLTYPLMVSKAVYEGQRETSSDKRVCILTRSAFPGQQRYGIINWSGDIGSDWGTFKRQIVAGLNFSITGMPYWTTDIGGFFRPGNEQYTSLLYHDLLTRWFQWGVFCPVFRMHGYMSETEPWKYGPAVEANMRKMLELRYRLLPYIYSEAWQVTSKGSTLMRPLVMDFSHDTLAVSQAYSYLFGKSLLVAPVVEPNVVERSVYLPKASCWYDLFSGHYYQGGQTINAAAPADHLPVFVRGGAILPVGPVVQYASENNWQELEIRIYAGANGAFELYEDEGDNYNYEQGVHSTIRFSWDNAKRVLTVGKRNGSFPNMKSDRTFKVILIEKGSEWGLDSQSKNEITVTYNGRKTLVNL